MHAAAGAPDARTKQAGILAVENRFGFPCRRGAASKSLRG